MTAGIYASRARMKTLLIEKLACGGQMLTADVIENFPGFPCGLQGQELADMMLKQAQAFGLVISTREVMKISAPEKDRDPFTVELDGGETLKSLSIIIATGAQWKKLDVPGEDALRGRGVSYCATCDGPLFRNKNVVVVGGGDTAVGDALFLTRFANKVTIVHRRDRLRAAQILQERVFANKKIELCMKSVVTAVKGSSHVEGVTVKSDSGEKTIKADGVFILIGLSPNSEKFKDLVRLCPKGYIESDDDMRTSSEGVFVCGDVRMKSLRQVVTAAGEGATAAVSAEHYVEKLKGREYPRR